MRIIDDAKILKNSASFLKRSIPILVLFLCIIQLSAQVKPTIKTQIDTASIKIGEQVQWTVTVDIDSTDIVIFPEGQTFSPLETVAAFATDTTRKKDRLTLQKKYALTQFDSGVYKLPSQRLEINGTGYMTDSMMVNVATIAVDTLAQKMYDIKPLINVEKSNANLWKYLIIGLCVLLLLGGLFYWFILRKKPLTEEEKVALLPPYDRALLELKRLENSKYLIQDEYKQYYSELTSIVRSYLEEDAHVTALESTTGQLIEKLELLKDAGELKLDDDTIKQFQQILQTADLVKFAKNKPTTAVAEQDRRLVEQIVVKTHDALPEPTEDELLEQAEYKEELERKKKKKKLVVGIASVIVIILIGTTIAGVKFGFGYLKDTVLGHPTKELLEGEWIRSTYGFPPIQLETPQVLVRQEVKLPPEAKATIADIQAFGYRSSIGLFTVATTSITMSQQEAEPEFEKTIEQILSNFESNGAKNIITKQEEFTSISGVKGLKVYGSGKFAVPESKELIDGDYTVLLFGGKGFQQYVILTWLEDDPYAQEIVDRILASVEVKTEV
jgi:flagellar basal body-associated protein FliL